MVNVTVSLSEEVKTQMDNFPEINWSGVVKKAIIDKASELTWKEEMLKKIKQETEFTDWTVKMGKKVNEGIAKKIKEKGLI